MKKCLKCNKEYSDNEKFCSYCGAKLENIISESDRNINASLETPSDEVKKFNNKRRKILIVIWSVVIILCIAIPIGMKTYYDGLKENAIEARTEFENDMNQNDDTENTTTSNSSGSTIGERNALQSAKDYLDTSGFSEQGLIEQLEYEGYTEEEATYAVDHCDVDWNDEAVRVAKDYIESMSFSRESLIEQLEYEGFTHEQAIFGANGVGY